MSETLFGQDKYCQTLFDQANLLYNNNELKKSAELLEEVLSINNEYVEAHFLVANIFHLQGKIGKALTSFKRVLEISPDHTDAMVSLSVILNDIGKYQEAKKYFELADSKVKKGNSGIVDGHVNKKFSLHHYEIAEMYSTYQRFDEALLEYHKAYSLDSDNLQIPLKISKTLHKQGQVQFAKNTVKELIYKSPDYVPALLYWGILHFGEGDILEAHKSWNKVLSKDPNHVEAKMYLNLSKGANEVNFQSI